MRITSPGRAADRPAAEDDSPDALGGGVTQREHTSTAMAFDAAPNRRARDRLEGRLVLTL